MAAAICRGRATEPCVHGGGLRRHVAEAIGKELAMAKMPRWRWWLWAVEAVLLIAVVEHFVIRPRMRREKPSQEKQVVQGEQVEALGEAAKPPIGLREVSPAYYPVINNDDALPFNGSNSQRW